MITDQQLESLAAQALNMAKVDLTRNGELGFFLASYHEGEALHRMRKIEKELERQLGKEWLDNGAAKDAGFAVLRMSMRLAAPDAIVMVTPGNFFKPTEKYDALSPDEMKRISDGGNDRYHEAAERGLFTIVDCLQVVAQTPERVCIRVQPREGNRFLDAPQTEFFPQADFGGRLKMFGQGQFQ